MLNIYLTRHGQDEDNANGILNGRRDTPLTQIGLNQADEVAQNIKDLGIKFSKIYYSPLKRTSKTAQIIAKKIGFTKPKKLDLLIERNFGVMSGKSHNQIEKLCYPNILKTKTFTYFLKAAGAETFPQLKLRARKLIEFLNQRCKDENVLLVTHGDFGKMIYCAYYNLSWREVLRMFHFGNSELILMSPNSRPEDVHVFHIERHNL